jgi:hypothetical protein
MAYLTERHLKCKKTEKFLESKGFILQKDCVYSKWTTFRFMLNLNIDDIILSDDDLYAKIAETSYYSGVMAGKKDALDDIHRSFNNIVFPPTHHKEPTYA